jgi:SAM-dependent methyltransferase
MWYITLMAIARESYYMFAKLSSVVDFKNKSVVQLGKQGGMASKRQVKAISKIFNLDFDYQPSSKYDFYRNYPSGDQIFRNLGFNIIDSIDVSNYEGANIVHDLNIPIPDNMVSKYDLVFDGGTTEHLFNQLNALENIHNLLKIGGVIVHYTPANNYLDHGFFQPQPSFYYEYYLENGYEIIDSYLIQAYRNAYRRRRVYEYKPLIYEHLSYGGWGNKMMGNWFACRKISSSTAGKMPQQKRYTEFLHVYEKPETGKTRRYLRFKQFFEQHPASRYYVLQVKHWFVKLIKLNRYLYRPRAPKPLFYA